MQTLELEVIKYGSRGPLYRVWHSDSVLVESTRDPEFAGARALLDCGITGAFCTKHRASATISMTGDIETAAQYCTADPDKGRLHMRKWSPVDFASIGETE